jgi:hypothetical protein
LDEVNMGGIFFDDMGPLPTEMGPTTAEVARARVQELETAIKDVVTQDLDNICWMDVYTKLAKLIGIEFNPFKLPKDIFDANCARFSLAMYTDKPYSQDELTRHVMTLRFLAEEHRRAKMMLSDAGYGVTGTPLLERLKEALERLESYENEDIPGEDN